MTAGSSPAVDRPLSDPGDDRLGYAPFAKTLAKAVVSMKAPDGMVVGIYGPWGSGKTTVLNFVEHYLQESDSPFTVIRFNPWWFSGRVDLAQSFFAQLQSAFMKWPARGNKVRKRLTKFGKAVGAIPGLEVAAAVSELIGVAVDIPALKESVSKALREQDTRVLVIVDDIDRLTHVEIAQLFAVIKSLADFPNTIYLLAFDPEIVAKAIERQFGGNGEAYLKKIIQVSFELPPPSERSLRTLFLEQLREIVGSVEDDLLDLAEWGPVLDLGILPLLESPRDVVRLTNALRVTYAAVAGEVNVTDFVSIEATRIFARAVYRLVRERPDMFRTPVGLLAVLPGASDAERKKFHEQWVQALREKDREPIQLLVATMFPRCTGDLPDAPVRFGGDRIRARHGRRIQDPEIYPIYFSLSLAPGDVSRAEVAAFLEFGSDVEAIAAALVALSNSRDERGSSKVRPMLDELISPSGVVGDEIRNGLIRALLKIGDKLCIPADDDPLGLGNDDRIVALVIDLIGRMPSEDRLSLLTEGIEAADGVWIPVMIVRSLERALGLDRSAFAVNEAPNEKGAPLGLDEVRILEELMLRTIHESADDGRLINAPALVHIMHAWTVWGQSTEVHAWVERIRDDDDSLGKLLVAFMKVTFGPGGSEHDRLNPNWMIQYADTEALVEHVARLSARDDRYGRAAREFLKEHEVIRSGGDPDSRFDR